MSNPYFTVVCSGCAGMSGTDVLPDKVIVDSVPVYAHVGVVHERKQA